MRKIDVFAEIARRRDLTFGELLDTRRATEYNLLGETLLVNRRVYIPIGRTKPRRSRRRGFNAREERWIVMAVSNWVHPTFENPPVIETAFSFEFAPLERWKVPHFGLYWETIRDRYPKLDVRSALPSQIEDLDEPPIPPKPVSFGIIDISPVRRWFYNETETQLIQTQNNRFIFNWKRGVAEEPYPHYRNIRPVIFRALNGA
jgi:hypothetical protein